MGEVFDPDVLGIKEIADDDDLELEQGTAKDQQRALGRHGHVVAHAASLLDAHDGEDPIQPGHAPGGQNQVLCL